MPEPPAVESKRRLSLEELLELSSEETRMIALRKGSMAILVYKELESIRPPVSWSIEMQRIAFECRLSQRWVEWCGEVRIRGGYMPNCMPRTSFK